MAEDSSNQNDPTQRRKLDSSEVAAEDLPTNQMPLPGGQVRQVRPATPSRGQRVQQGQSRQGQPRRDASGALSRPRPPQNGAAQPPLPRSSTPRKVQPRPPNGQAPRPANGQNRSNAAPLLQPTLKPSAAIPQTLTPRRMGMSTRKKVSLGVLIALALILATAGWWVLGRYDHFKNVIDNPDPTTGLAIHTTYVAPLPVDTHGIIETPVPGVVPTQPAPPPPTEPLNILLLGLDLRPTDTTGPRSDTMILIHIDPTIKKVSMLSIPRDLWVTIPGLGQPTKDRINSAYEYGEDQHITGGGPAMAKAVVKYNFGVNVDYFAEVDFQGFVKIVDELGGVNIDVAKPLVDNQFPTADNGLKRVLVLGGIQHMDGTTALEYARSRHQDSDLGRNQRQQQVLLAIKQKGLDLFSTLPKVDQLMDALRGAVRTDLDADQIISLIQLAATIPGGNITQAAIGGDMVTETIIPDTGADVLMPDWDKIRPLVAQLFGGNSVALEGARIMLLNGTHTEGLATRTADELKLQGFKIVGTDNDNTAAHPKTVIIDYANKSFTADELAKALGLSADIVQNGTNGPPNVDIEVIIGDDKASAAQ